MIRPLLRWLTAIQRRAASRYRRQRYCANAAHRITLAWPYGEMRWVCLDCPHTEPLGHIYYGASNHSHPYSP